MMNFSRKGTEVTAEIEANVGVEKRFFTFTINLSDDVYAYMLRENFQTKMSRALQTIREEAYEQGWKAAKAKRARATWFSGQWK